MFTASQVEARTGIPAATLRQWERRYGFPAPIRTANGYRLYSPRDLAQLEEMQRHLRAGVPASRAAQLARAAVWPQEALAVRLTRALTAALVDFDPGKAAAVLSEAHASLRVEDVLLHVMTPALVEIGERWARGELTVAQEHQASAFLRGRVAALLDFAGLGTFGPTVIAAGAPGEHHEIGLMMVALLLRRQGVQVEYLGVNLPLADLAAYARQRQARALLLALNGDWALPATRAQHHHLLTLGVPLYYGGGLLNAQPHLAAELGGRYAGPDAHAAAQTILADLRERWGQRWGPGEGQREQ